MARALAVEISRLCNVFERQQRASGRRKIKGEFFVNSEPNL